MCKDITCFCCKENITEDDLLIVKMGRFNRKFHKSKKCYEDYVFGQTHKCKHCGERIHIDEEYEEISDSEEYLHDRCIDEYNEKRKEHDDWCKLFEYVKGNILGYEKEMKLSKYQITRLKGLRDGEFISTKGKKKKQGYPYNIIYLTFLFKTNDILYALKTKTFDNESRKFDYIMVIIENNINTIYIRMIEQEKANTRLEETTKRLSDRKKQEENHGDIAEIPKRSPLNMKLLKALEDDGDGMGI